MTRQRRRPVPVEWREEHHWLNAGSTRHHGVRRGSGSYTRAWGRCSCGEQFGTLADDHTLHAPGVREAWMKHVEAAYYGSAEGTTMSDEQKGPAYEAGYADGENDRPQASPDAGYLDGYRDGAFAREIEEGLCGDEGGEPGGPVA